MKEHRDAYVTQRGSLRLSVNNDLSPLSDCNKDNVKEFLFTIRMCQCEDYRLLGRGDKYTVFGAHMSQSLGYGGQFNHVEAIRELQFCSTFDFYCFRLFSINTILFPN